MDLNRATILGRLTRDPELRSTTTGKTVATMSVATGRVWTDGSGNRQESSEFHNCVIWGKLAEIVGQYLSKGSRIYAEGRIQTRDWTGKDGVKRYRTEIVVNNFIMLDGPRKGNSESAAPPPPLHQDTGETEPPTIDVTEEEIKVEDIPF